MTGREKGEIAELKEWMFGEDGTGGAVGELRADMKTLRSDMDKLKGGMQFAAFLGGFIGLSGLGAIIVAVVHASQK